MKNMTTDSPFASKQHPVRYKTIRLNELDIFYREAGAEEAPTILLLHGFPTSSNMFRNLIPRLASSFHVVAPDYPGFGQSSMPSHKDFAYTFENLTNVVEQLYSRKSWTHQLLPLRNGLRCADRLPPGVAASRARAGAHRAKWQRVR